jgi:hypothetical protein
MEMLRVEREEWEVEAGTERKRREELEDEVARLERRCVEERSRAGKAEDGARRENERAANLQDVLEEFQAGEPGVFVAAFERETSCRADVWERKNSRQGRRDQTSDKRARDAVTSNRPVTGRVQGPGARSRGGLTCFFVAFFRLVFVHQPPARRKTPTLRETDASHGHLKRHGQISQARAGDQGEERDHWKVEA